MENSAEADFDRLRRRVPWTMPSGLYIVGTRAGDRLNAMTLSWATQVSFEPKLLGVGVEKQALTHELAEDSGVFALSILSREDRTIVRKFTKPVETDLVGRTMNGFGYHDGKSGAPIMDFAMAFADCRIVDKMSTGDHTFFVGEILDAGFQKPEDTPVLRMEDTRMNYGG